MCILSANYKIKGCFHNGVSPLFLASFFPKDLLVQKNIIIFVAEIDTQKHLTDMKNSIITLLLTCISVVCSYGQSDSKYQFGNYVMEPMSTTNKGNPMYLGIKNRKTQQWIYKPLTKVCKPEEPTYNYYNAIDGNFYATFVNGIQFLKQEQGYHYDFDGMVWVVPENEKMYIGGNRNSSPKYTSHGIFVFSAEENRWKPWFSGIFKIQDDRLVPMLKVDGWGTMIRPLKNLPLVVLTKIDSIPQADAKIWRNWYDNKISKKKKYANAEEPKTRIIGKSYVYDSDFELLKEFDGRIKFPDDGTENYTLIRNDGTEEFLDIAALVTGGALTNDGQDRWGIADKDGKLLVPCVMSKDTALIAYKDRRIWSFSEYKRRFIAEKSDFETKAEYDARMNNPELQEQYAASKGLDKKFMQNYRIQLGRYDAETGTFPVKGISLGKIGNEVHAAFTPWNDFSLSVPRSEAEKFQTEFRKIYEEALKQAKLCIINDAVAVEEITFTTSEGKTYSWKRE